MENEILAQILSELKELRQGQAKLEQGQAKLEQGQAKLERGQSMLERGQTKLERDLVELRMEMNERFDAVEYSLNQAWKDIGLVESRVKQHEREFHGIGMK